ncbi:MAG: AAA family ATPase [Planctomycetia bacterium]|jgi:uncharacterized protein YhaN
MKITSLKVDGFGVWKGLEFKKLNDGLNVFCGLNEAGKSTLMQFIRSMLYGFDGERRRYLPPVYGGRPGGLLTLSDTAGRFQLTRHDDERDMTDRAKVILQSPDGTQAGESLLQTLLSDIDEATFNNVFAVGLQEMQELGTLGDSEAAEMLFRLSAGLDRVSIVEVLQELANSRSMLLDDEGRTGRIPQLITQRDQLREELDHFAGLLDEYGRLAGLRNGLNHEVTELQRRTDRLQQESRTLEIAVNLREKWQRRNELGERLARFQSPVTIPTKTPARLKELTAKRRRYRQKIDEIKQLRRDVRAEAAELRVNTRLVDMSPRIEAFAQQQGWIGSLQSRIGQLENEIGETQKLLDAERDRLGIRSLPILVPTFSTDQVKQLRRTSKQLVRTEQQHEEVRRRHDKARSEAENVSGEATAELHKLGETNLNEAMERTGTLVAQLNRRVQVEDQIASLQRSQTELDDQCRSLIQRQLMPMGMIVGLGVLVVLGLVFLIIGLVVNTLGPLGWGLSILGALMTVGAIVLKIQTDRSNNHKLESAQQHLKMVQMQLQQAIEQRNQLDALLPTDGQTAPTRLATAQKHLTALEALMPSETRRRAAAETVAAAEAEMRNLEYQLAQIGQRWEELLAANQLPGGLTPVQVRSIVEQSDRLHELAERLRRSNEDLDRNRQEYLAVVDRIRQLAVEADVPVATSDPCEILQALRDQIQTQQQTSEKRAALQTRWRQLGRRATKIEKQARRLGRRRRKILDSLDLKDEHELQEKLDRQAQAEKLLEEQLEIEATIESAIAGCCTEQTIARILATEEDDTLTARWDAMESDLRAAKTRLAECHEEKGRLAQQLDDIAKDRSADRKRLELGTIEKQLDEAVQRWQVLALTETTLRSIKSMYEEQRQPETLKEASDYLCRLTNGRYTRIWTPFGEDVLRVDDAMGNVLPVDVLSRGTREQLFLALRLALVRSYAERGVTLPLVLDDVLVNFDAPRAKAAADVLNEFTRQGHQVFIFTCHDHVYHMFQNLGVHTQMLPRRTNQDSNPAPTSPPPKPSRRKTDLDEPISLPETDEQPEPEDDPPEESEIETEEPDESAKPPFDADDEEVYEDEDEEDDELYDEDEEYYEYDFDDPEEEDDDEEDEDWEEDEDAA